MQNYYLGDVHGNFDDLGGAIVSALAAEGIEASYSSKKVTIPAWNGLSLEISIPYTTTPQYCNLFICFDEGSECIILVNKTLNNSADNQRGAMCCRIAEGTGMNKTINYSDFSTRLLYLNKEVINITKLINTKDYDISNLGLYIADSEVAWNAIYIDESGKKFLGISKTMLIEYN